VPSRFHDRPTDLASAFTTIGLLPITDTGTDVEEFTMRHHLAPRRRQTSPSSRASPSRTPRTFAADARMCRSMGCQRFRTQPTGHVNHSLQPTAMQSPAILVARWVLVCRGTTRHTTARHDTGTGEVADETVQTDTEITDPIAEQRTLNPLARSARLKHSARHPTGFRLRDMTDSEAPGLCVNRWALIGRRHSPRAALNIPQLHPMDAADLHFRVSPLVADMLGLP
jgi:hypothetical protein